MNIMAPPTNPRARRTPGIPLPAAADFAARLVAILFSVTQLIFARGSLFAALAIPLHNRIAGASRRIANLLARLANGTFRPRSHTQKPGSKGSAPPIYLPHAHAWLTRKLTYQLAGAYALQLEFLLNDPQTQALIAAAPPEALKSLGRTIRPLARLLGVPLPAKLQLPPRPPRIRPARPTPALTPPEPPPSPHEFWRRAHRRGLPPPLFPTALFRKTRI